MHQLNSTKRARVTSNAIHLPGSRILHYVRFRYPIQATATTTTTKQKLDLLCDNLKKRKFLQKKIS
jgi:hypothetical protein